MSIPKRRSYQVSCTWEEVPFDYCFGEIFVQATITGIYHPGTPATLYEPADGPEVEVTSVVLHLPLAAGGTVEEEVAYEDTFNDHERGRIEEVLCGAEPDFDDD